MLVRKYYVNTTNTPKPHSGWAFPTHLVRERNERTGLVSNQERSCANGGATFARKSEWAWLPEPCAIAENE